MPTYGVEWLLDDRRYLAVAEGGRDLDFVASKLKAAGLRSRFKRVTKAAPLQEREFVVWEM